MSQPDSNLLSVDDVISPEEAEVDFSNIRINNRLYRSFFVSGYPRYIEPNWLEPLIDFDHTLDISMFIYPSQSQSVLDDLKRKIAEMEATIQTDTERGKEVNPSVMIALEDARDLQDQLARGAERFFRLGLYITVPAQSKEELNNTSKLVQSTLGSLSITAKETTLQMEEAFNSTLPLGVDLLNLDHNMDTTSLATTFPFTTSELTANEGVLYGINEHNGSLVIFDRFSLENSNSVVFAKSGAGKSLAGWEKVLVMNEKDEVTIKEIGPLIEAKIKGKKLYQIEKNIEGIIDPELKVWTFDKDLKGRWSKVTVAARKKFTPRNKLYKITTKSGRQITVTADHNLVTLRRGRIRAMRSEAIRIGEAIPIPRFVKEPNNAPVFIHPKDYLENWPNHLPKTIPLDKSLLTLLGLATSEGYVKGKMLRIFNTDPQVNWLTERCAHSIGAKTFILRNQGEDTGRAITPNYFAILFCSLGVGGLSGEKQTPSILFSLSNKQLAHYLKAYYEGDGGVEEHSVCATTKSEQLASDLAYLLLRFGVIARISHKQKFAKNTVNKTIRTYYQITISGKDNLLRFAESIGFLTERKNFKLKELLEKDTIANTNVDTIPTLQPILKSICNNLFPSSEIQTPQKLIALKNGAYEPSREDLLDLINICESRIAEIRTLSYHIKLLKRLPALSKIIRRGSKNRILNSKLWQALGESWRGMKNSLYTPFTKNVLIAYQTITGQAITLAELNTALYSSFKQQGISLRNYNKSLWTSIVDRKTGNSCFETVFRAAQYISKQYRSTQLKIRHTEKKLVELKALANSDLLWDPIVKIEQIKHKENYVYDLQVDNGVFLAGSGGMFVHNSYMIKLEALRSMMFDTQVIVIDPEQEYLRLCQAVGGSYINFSSDSLVKINPFDMSDLVQEGENELGRKILSLTGFLKLVLGNLDASQSAVLDRALSSTYRLKGITADPKTQKLTPPLMEDLYKVLIGMEEPNAQELAFRLERFIKGSLSGIFSSQSNLKLDSQMIVFSVRDLADQLRPLAMYLILDYIWTKIRTDKRKRLLIVEEAWYMMKNPDSASFLVEIAKRARKYYLGVTTVTQDVEDFLSTDHGKEIISNSSIQILLKQSPASIDRVGEIFYLSEGEKRLLLSAGVGQGLFFAGATHVAITVVASPQEHSLVNTSPKAAPSS